MRVLFLLLHLIPSSPLNGHTRKRTHAHALPYFQWKGEPQPRLLKVHLASVGPLQLHLPQLEAMNQLVTLSFYSCRITLTTAPRKFRGICPLRWAEGHTHRRAWTTAGVFSGRSHLVLVVVVVSASPEALAYSVGLYFWIEIMGDMHILHAEQLSGGSCLNKLQHARTLYKTY